MKVSGLASRQRPLDLLVWLEERGARLRAQEFPSAKEDWQPKNGNPQYVLQDFHRYVARSWKLYADECDWFVTFPQFLPVRL